MAQLQRNNSEMKQSIKPAPISDSKKYLNHFQSINSPIKIPPNFLPSNSASTSKNKFSNAIQIYGSPFSASIIDKIADLPVKQSQVTYVDNDQNDFVRTPMIINLGSKIKDRVMSINNFFTREGASSDNQQEDTSLNGYIRNIINIDLNNTLPLAQLRQSRGRSNTHSKSRSKQSSKAVNIEKKGRFPPHPTPPKQQIKINQEQQVRIDPIVFTERTTPSKLKKMDLLLVQIMRQKKRKGLAPDYFRVIQVKLVQLLEYILQDEPQYSGLTLVDKMKEVLINLESFKGKSIEGQSKVNMLRIFFQQFRNLKKQRQEQIQGRENRSHSQSKKSQKHEQKKLHHNEAVNSTHIYPKTKRNHDTLSMGGIKNQNKNSHKNPSSKSVKEQDQWIGSIDG